MKVPSRKCFGLGRRTTPGEVVQVLLFRAGNESHFRTGGIYLVDGGISVTKTLKSFGLFTPAWHARA
jgi:hypothetical protein